MSDLQKDPSSVWNTATREDIGTAFKVARGRAKLELDRKTKEVARAEEQRLRDENRVKTIMDRAAGIVNRTEVKGEQRHPFLNGRNRFIFYRIKVPKNQSKKKSTKVEPINYKNKVTKKQSVEFTTSLGANIEQASNFFLREIMPLSLSLMSSVERVDEIVQQLTEDKAELPIDFIKNKAKDAVHLRIIRFLCDSYGLNKNERRMMTVEYRTRKLGF